MDEAEAGVDLCEKVRILFLEAERAGVHRSVLLATATVILRRSLTAFDDQETTLDTVVRYLHGQINTPTVCHPASKRVPGI